MKVTVSHTPTATDGGIWKRSDLDSGKKIRVLKCGVGEFWERSDLDSGKKIRVLKFGGGGGVLESQNPKCKDPPKFQFSGGCSGKGQIWTQERKLEF